MLTDIQKEFLRDKVLELLARTGMRIEHKKMVKDLLARGCEESPVGRVRIPRQLIEELAASQRRSQAEDAEKEKFLNCFGVIDWGNFLFWTNRWEEEREKMRHGVRTSIFDCGPTRYYDYPSAMVRPVDTDIFIQMKKWAEVVPEIGYTSTWYRQDVPQEIERIDSLVLALKYTDKVGGIEAMIPAHIKYLIEIGEILTGRPNETAYICGSQCITPPLVFDRRSAEETVERVRRNVHRFHVASMMSVGMNTPVTPAAAIVAMAAEVLGGMVAVFVQDPEADITGRMLASIVDMRNAQVTSATVEATLINIAVKELFDTFWGGHLRVDSFFTVCAKRPGLQAVYESFAGGQRFARLLGLSDINYPGVGSLDNGGVGSPTQAVLDLEIRKSQFIPETIQVDEESIPFEEMCTLIEEEKDFLTSEHTLQNMRKLWSSRLFRTDDPATGQWAGDEKAILDECDRIWREQVETYTPLERPADQLKALDDVVARAKKELLGV